MTVWFDILGKTLVGHIWKNSKDICGYIMIECTKIKLNYELFNLDLDNPQTRYTMIEKNFNVIVTIGDYEFSFINHIDNDAMLRRYYLTLSNFPQISKWELYQLLMFIKYENEHNRKVGIWSEKAVDIHGIKKYLSRKYHIKPILPDKITACTACSHNGCLTEYVMHITSVEDSESILSSGKMLSASRVKEITGDINYINKRNAVGDPLDYSDYIMFSWANCQAGDRITVERKIGRFPSEEDMEKHYIPAPRFYFKYSEIIKHNGATFDGYHPVKIKDELILNDNLHLCIIPQQLRSEFTNIINQKLSDKVMYIKYNNEDIWEWSEKTYNELLRY